VISHFGFYEKVDKFHKFVNKAPVDVNIYSVFMVVGAKIAKWRRSHFDLGLAQK
jgi:limonene-1,2-epoxide hydrolase